MKRLLHSATEPTEMADPISLPPESTCSHPRRGDRSVSDDLVANIERSIDWVGEAIDPEHDHTPPSCDLSVIVPVFNERATLPKVLKRIDDVMPPATQLVVVDDGSTDGTATWLSEQPPQPNRIVLRRRRNHGKGSAVRLAIRHTSGRVVAIQDADLEYDPADLLRVTAPIFEGRADVVYGSRYLTAGSDHSIVHRLGNWALTQLSNGMSGLRLTDMETCHKAFRGDLVRSIPLKECRFGFEPEITAKVAARGASVIEVPSGYRGRGYREGKKIGWKDGIAALACMWRYR